MTRVGLIGGTSYLATLGYYKALNEVVYERTGGNDLADCVIFSVNFGELERRRKEGNLDRVLPLFQEAAVALKGAGAEALAICANTPHRWADKISGAAGLPLIHIGEATARRAAALGYQRVALLGTRFTMEEPFIREKFEQAGLAVVIPVEPDRTFIDDSIFNELTHDLFSAPTRVRYLKIIATMAAQGCDCAALACTEIPLLLDGCETSIPSLDTMRIHVDSIADVMLNQ